MQNDLPPLDYDLQDDLVFFMNNEPMFYRKQYYPTMLKFYKFYKSGRSVSPRGFERLVSDGYKDYYNKFRSASLPQRLNPEMLEKICHHIHTQELENCKNGVYE